MKVLKTDVSIRLLVLSHSDFLNDEFSLPSDLVVNAPGPVIRTLPLNSALKYCFLLSIEKRWPDTYLPPEMVRIIFSYLVCHVHRTVSIV
mmetsp:Transcript_10973/g.17919  ORF Transcript_10973/g.17919 Transcript_10973/m.17919 type:complete len:90 (+) Transcript_10973:97-366(+)